MPARGHNLPMTITIWLHVSWRFVVFLGKGPKKVALFPSHKKGCAYKFICKMLVSSSCLGANLCCLCGMWHSQSHCPQGLAPHFVLWTHWVDLKGPVPTHCLAVLKLSPVHFLFLFLVCRLLRPLLKPSLGIPGASPTVIHPIPTAFGAHTTRLYSQNKTWCPHHPLHTSISRLTLRIRGGKNSSVVECLSSMCEALRFISSDTQKN